MVLLEPAGADLEVVSGRLGQLPGAVHLQVAPRALIVERQLAVPTARTEQVVVEGQRAHACMHKSGEHNTDRRLSGRCPQQVIVEGQRARA